MEMTITPKIVLIGSQFFVKGTSQPAIFTHPFPLYKQQMASQNPSPPPGGNAGHPTQGDCSTHAHNLMMCNETIGLTTQAKTYDTIPKVNTNGGASDQPS